MRFYSASNEDQWNGMAKDMKENLQLELCKYKAPNVASPGDYQPLSGGDRIKFCVIDGK